MYYDVLCIKLIIYLTYCRYCDVVIYDKYELMINHAKSYVIYRDDKYRISKIEIWLKIILLSLEMIDRWSEW